MQPFLCVACIQEVVLLQDQLGNHAAFLQNRDALDIAASSWVPFFGSAGQVCCTFASVEGQSSLQLSPPLQLLPSVLL